MAFLQLLGTDIIDVQDSGDVEITHDQQMIIAKSKYGHSQFSWINNQLVEKQDFIAAQDIARARSRMVVTRFQALAALHNANLLTSVQSIMSAPETDMLVKLAWDNAQTFERTSPSILAIAQVLGLTDQQLDTLFTQASQIKA